ncbi:hypothetical protein Ccrd_006799, partial [Cynara cardunculus var. scolymus]
LPLCGYYGFLLSVVSDYQRDFRAPNCKNRWIETKDFISKSVKDFIFSINFNLASVNNLVHDWDSEVMVSARFKAFSGQRSDWESRYYFWRDLIIKIARHLHIFIIRPSVVKNVWFNHGGLTPLCLDHVLEKSMEVIKLLRDDHWTCSCIVTMSKFQVICGGPKEASVILSHLSKCGKAKYLAIRRKDLIEGVKFSLSLQTVSGITSPDYDVLHLIWTAEKLQLQLDMIDQRREKSKMLALASLKSGNKISALRQATEMKLASESREKCNLLLMRVEEVFEAIQSGSKTIKDRQITIEEVELCLDELDETINSQKQVEKLLGSVWSYEEFDEDLEDELDKLMLEESGKSESDGGTREQESLSKSLSDLKLSDNNNNNVVVTRGVQKPDPPNPIQSKKKNNPKQPDV